MPRNLVGNDQTFPTQTTPLAGEARTAQSVETPFQNSADRAAYLKRRLDFIHTDTEGVRMFRRVADIAALQALSDRPDKSVVQVDGVGLYQFDAANVLAELSPFTIKPNAITHPAPGRWRIAGAGVGTLDVPNGIPSLDEDGNLPTSRLAAAPAGRILGEHIKFGLVDFQHGYAPSCPKVSGTSFVDVSDPQFTVAAKSGDRLRVLASFLALNDGVPGTDACDVSIVTVSPGLVSQEIPGGHGTVKEQTGHPVALNAIMPINATGNWLVKLQVRSLPGGQSWLVDIAVSTELIRP